jgi:SAM-dependent methyltransferase
MSMAARLTCPPEWLALREPADAAARAPEPLAVLRARLPGRPLIRDLGCGTGAMARWLSPRLPGPQHWVLHDLDAGLLARAAAGMPATAGDGTPLTFAVERRDLTRLTAAALDGTALVTASALLDLLTAEEIEGLATACAAAGCLALFTLSVTGRVRITPGDPLDAAIEHAFNDHQRRVARGRRLLGPDASAVAAAAFERSGATVARHPSPWRLGPEHAALTAEWLAGRVDAACAQRPELAAEASAYLRRRREACAAGVLRVEVGHEDLLVFPGEAR